MAKKKYTKLTHSTLKHVLMWGDQLSKKESWNKADANTYAIIKAEIEKILHERYVESKKTIMNPYLDPKQPYHTT